MYKIVKDNKNIKTTTHQPKDFKNYLPLKVILYKVHNINNFFSRESSFIDFYSGKVLYYAK